MILVNSVTFTTYGGVDVTFHLENGFFYEPLWKVKEILLDRFIAACKKSSDPIVKVRSMDYKEYGKR